MKSLLRIRSANFYFGFRAVIGIPGACDLVTGIAFGKMEDVIRGIAGSVIAGYLLYCALVINRGRIVLLDTVRSNLSAMRS